MLGSCWTWKLFLWRKGCCQNREGGRGKQWPASWWGSSLLQWASVRGDVRPKSLRVVTPGKEAELLWMSKTFGVQFHFNCREKSGLHRKQFSETTFDILFFFFCDNFKKGLQNYYFFSDEYCMLMLEVRHLHQEKRVNSLVQNSSQVQHWFIFFLIGSWGTWRMLKNVETAGLSTQT